MNRNGRLFSLEIENDPWVLYHGSSNLAEARIATEGLKWRPALYTQSDIKAVCSIFEKLGWAGVHGGGYAALKPFSLSHDFAGSSTKPIFLAATSHRAALYASKDFCGGEAVRALHYAIGDLAELAAHRVEIGLSDFE